MLYCTGKNIEKSRGLAMKMLVMEKKPVGIVADRFGVNRTKRRMLIDQVREILDGLTNQLGSIGEKMKSANSWQKGQLSRNSFKNPEINNKNEASFRWKKSPKHIFNNASTEEFRSGVFI